MHEEYFRVTSCQHNGYKYTIFTGVCVFQTKVATDSRRSLPPIPRESCH